MTAKLRYYQATPSSQYGLDRKVDAIIWHRYHMADKSSALPERLRLIFDLTKEAGTLREAQKFLAARQLHFSADSWDDFFEKRVTPVLADGTLSEDDLVELLGESEEHARQHVFLFQTNKEKAKQLADCARIRRELEKQNSLSILDRALVLNKPSVPQLSQIRWEKRKFVVKIIETRAYRKTIDEQRQGNKIITTEEEITFRAVNLFQLHNDGLLEMRLQSHRNSSQYRADITRMWNIVGSLLPQDQFEEWPIVAAKNFIVQEQAQLKGEIEHKNLHLRNDEGVSISVATPDALSDIFTSDSASESVRSFLPRASCEKAGVIFHVPTQEEEQASSHVRVRLAGLDHEFVLTASCSKRSYEYVLRKIRDYNKSDAD